MDVLFYTQYCSVVDVWCDGRPISHTVWWMSFFTHGVVDVWCGGCLCGGPTIHDIEDIKKMLNQKRYRN